jgi:hypothetical protein
MPQDGISYCTYLYQILQEKHHVIVTELYDLSYKNKTPRKTELFNRVAHKAKPPTGKKKLHKMEYVVIGGTMNTCLKTPLC